MAIDEAVKNLEKKNQVSEKSYGGKKIRPWKGTEDRYDIRESERCQRIENEACGR